MHNTFDLYQIRENLSCTTSWSVDAGTIEEPNGYAAHGSNHWVISMNQCCGSAVELNAKNLKFYVKQRPDIPSPYRYVVPNKGVLLCPYESQKQIKGSTRVNYKLGEYNFTLYLADQDYFEYEIVDFEFRRTIKNCVNSFGELLHSYPRDGTPTKPEKRTGYIYTPFFEGLCSWSSDRLKEYDITDKDKVYFYLNKFKIAMDKMLSTGSPVILIVTNKQLAKFEDQTNRADVSKYIVGRHEGVYNLNYLERRLNVFVFYKD